VGVWARVAGLMFSLVLLCGCSQQSSARDDLIHALNETHGAIASSLLAIQLYDQQRSTRAVTETVLGDMSKQAVDAERSLESVSVDSEQIKSERDAALTAIHAGVAALLSSRDDLEQQGAVADTAGLESSGREVDALLNQLRSSQ
jgi:hypothetical protein